MNICPICSHSTHQKWPMYYEFESQHFYLLQCSSCRIGFVSPQPDEKTIVRMYSKDYFESDFRCGHEDASAFNKKTDPVLPDWTEQVHLQPESSVLEIGCATGYTLKAFHDAGHHVKGIEISEDAARHARDVYHLDVDTMAVHQAQFSSEKFDLIYLLDVFEHLTDPVLLLKQAYQWLKPGGTLVIVIPTQTNTLFSRFGMTLFSLAGKRTRIYMPPYHLFEYRPSSVRRLLLNHGFSKIIIKPVIMKPGEIGLRSSVVQNKAKYVFQCLNYPLTKLTGRFGDRLTIIAVKS